MISAAQKELDSDLYHSPSLQLNDMILVRTQCFTGKCQFMD